MLALLQQQKRQPHSTYRIRRLLNRETSTTVCYANAVVVIVITIIMVTAVGCCSIGGCGDGGGVRANG